MFFGKPGPWFEGYDFDGDKNEIFHDVDGSVTGYKDTYVSRMDNFLVQHPGCKNVTSWFGSVCSGKYAQVNKPKCSRTLFLHPYALECFGKCIHFGKISHPFVHCNLPQRAR